MAKAKLLNQEYQVTAEIPMAFMRYLETRADERVLEVVLVYNGVDRFDTVISPDGMKTDPSVVTVDYNHNRFNTGAYLRNTRVIENYELEDGTVLARALIGDIHIPKDAEMYHRNKDGEKVSAGKLYEAVTKGHVRSVSVEFRPYKGKQVTDTETGITTFREWDLLRLSLLDVTPGQPYSGIKITRSLINNNMSKQPKNQTRYLEELIKVDGKLGVITAQSTDGTNLKATATFADGSTQEYSWTEGEDRPFVYASQGDFFMAINGLDTPSKDVSEPTDTETDDNTRESEIEIEVIKESKDSNNSEEGLAGELDTDGDGEISDQELRSYITEVKRAYKDPKMIKEAIGELVRMYDDLKKRMDDKEVSLQTDTKTKDEVEAERIRQLKSNLAGIPEEVVRPTGNGKVTRSLGDDYGQLKQKSQDDHYTEKYEETLTAIKSGMYK